MLIRLAAVLALLATPAAAQTPDPDSVFPNAGGYYDGCKGAAGWAGAAAMDRERGRSLNDELSRVRIAEAGRPWLARQIEITRHVWGRPDVSPREFHDYYLMTCEDRVDDRLSERRQQFYDRVR